MTSQSVDVIVVGGGVVGASAAYFLAREGLRTTLLERGEIAGEASGVAAGMLTPVGDAAHSDAMSRFGFASLDAFPSWCETLRECSGIDPEFERSGALRVATNRREFETLRKLGAEVGASHPESELAWLSKQDALRLEPDLPDETLGALWSPSEAHVRSASLTRALAAAASRFGAEVVEGVSVQRVLRSGDAATGVATSDGDFHAGFVLLCCGPWAPELSPAFADAPLPVVPVRGQLVALDQPHPPLRRIVWSGDVYLVPKRDGSVLVGATEEHAGFDKRVTADGVDQLLCGGKRLLRSLEGARFREAQVALRPGSPDGLPAIAPSTALRGLALAAGHFRNGILLAPATGELLRDIVLGKADTEALDAFSPERWHA